MSLRVEYRISMQETCTAISLIALELSAFKEVFFATCFSSSLQRHLRTLGNKKNNKPASGLLFVVLLVYIS